MDILFLMKDAHRIARLFTTLSEKPYSIRRKYITDGYKPITNENNLYEIEYFMNELTKYVAVAGIDAVPLPVPDWQLDVIYHTIEAILNADDADRLLPPDSTIDDFARILDHIDATIEFNGLAE